MYDEYSWKFESVFAGLQVEAMSSEKNLRVRVKVFDNSTTIYSQDVEIIQGEGTFVVPAMLSDNEIIVLQVSSCDSTSNRVCKRFVYKLYNYRARDLMTYKSLKKKNAHNEIIQMTYEQKKNRLKTTKS